MSNANPLSEQLFEAIWNRDINRVRKALSEGADTSIVDPGNGYSAIDCVLRIYSDGDKRTEPFIFALMNHMSDVQIAQNVTAIAGDDQIDVILYLAKENPLLLGMLANDYDLMETLAKKACHKMIELLMKHGMDPQDITNKTGWSILNLLTDQRENKRGSVVKTIQVLLDNGVDPNVREQGVGFTPIYRAVDEKVVACLLDGGVNITDYFFKSILKEAWNRRANAEVANLLLERGANLNFGPGIEEIEKDPENPMAKILTAAWRKQTLGDIHEQAKLDLSEKLDDHPTKTKNPKM